MSRYFCLFVLLFLVVGCKTARPSAQAASAEAGKRIAISPRPKSQAQLAIQARKPSVPDSSFVNLREYSVDFDYDMKYATSDNFLKSQVYDCAECYLRLKTVKALVKANAAFMAQGYRIKIFDCYRPLDIQKRMWAIVPNADYVANPAKGSIHNRGGAVDITLVDSSGKELDMGTGFDHFGPEAAPSFTSLPEEAKANRLLLSRTMAKSGFKVLSSEWWHFNFEGAASNPLANFKWECE